MSAKETVLVIGGTGQIGTQVTVQEIAAGKEVHVFGRSPASSSKLDFITKAPNGHYTSVDVSGDQKKLAALIKQINPAKIYFMAEPFPMKEEDVSKAVNQMGRFYHTLQTEVGFKGPVVVIGTAGIELTGQNFPTQVFTADNERILGQIPYFRARRQMAAACRNYTARGLDIRRVALPWVVSGDAHHGDMEALPQFASGSMSGFGLPDVPMDVISGQESARAIRFIADKGTKGWTYQAGGVPNIPISQVMQAQLTEIGGGRLKTSQATPQSLITQTSTLLSLAKMKRMTQRNPWLMGWDMMWEGVARGAFNIASNVTITEAQTRAATACALSATLPAKADMAALIKLGFKPTDQNAQRTQVFAEARKLARLLLRDGIVRRQTPPGGPRY